jgi:transcriptional regulator with XRE-family HTH domain
MKQLVYDNYLIQFVKRARLQQNIKQSFLANAIKVNRTTYGRMESGRLAFSPGQLRIIVKELKIDFLKLIDSAERTLSAEELAD